MAQRIYTNDRIDESPTWMAETVRLPFAEEGGGVRRAMNALGNARRAVRLAGADDIVILTDTHNLSGSLFGLLERRRRERPTILRTDPLLTLPRGRLAACKRAYLRAALETVDRLVVWAPAVIERYARHFGIPRDKMTAHRFHHTLQGYAFDNLEMGDYLFSGGDSLRDYATLFAAVEGLPIKVKVATRLRLPGTLRVPANVEVGAVTAGEFRRLMAGAYAVVFPLRTDRLRTCGQQSYLNAMALGKAVIVTDRLDAPYYIEDGRTGCLVNSGDAAGLRRAIEALLGDRERAAELGAAAREVALPMDQEKTWCGVLEIALRQHRLRHAFGAR